MADATCNLIVRLDTLSWTTFVISGLLIYSKTRYHRLRDSLVTASIDTSSTLCFYYAIALQNVLECIISLASECQICVNGQCPSVYMALNASAQISIISTLFTVMTNKSISLEYVDILTFSMDIPYLNKVIFDCCAQGRKNRETFAMSAKISGCVMDIRFFSFRTSHA